MTKILRKSGIDCFGEIPWGTHFCQFYDNASDLTEILVPYFKAGIENNEFCLLVSEKSPENNDLLHLLKKAVPDFDQCLYTGQFEILTPKQAYLPDGVFNVEKILAGWLKKHHQAAAKGYEGTRVAGNTAWLRKRDWAKFTSYEDAINDSIASLNLIALCPYPVAKRSDIEIVDVIRNHAVALIKRDGIWEAAEGSELSRMERALSLERDKLKGILDAMEDGVYIVNQNHDIQYVNSVTEKEFGAVEGRACHQYFHDRSEPCPWCKNAEVFAGKSVKWEWSCAKNNKTYELFDTPLRNADGSVFKLEFFHDISEHKRAEEVLRRGEQDFRVLVENAPDIIVRFGRDLRYLYANPAVEVKTGIPVQTFIGKIPHELDIPKELAMQLERTVYQVFKTGTSCKEELAYSSQEGTIYSEARFVPEMAANDSVQSVLVIARDVTKFKLAQAELTSSHDQLRNLTEHMEKIQEEQRTAIAREIHDELGPSLTSLKMDAFWLSIKMDAGDASLLERIGAMISQIDATIKTVQRISAELRPGILDDLGLVAAMEWQAKDFRKRTGISCDIKVVLADRTIDRDRSTTIFRIFQEILTNVYRHAEATRVKVTLSEVNGSIVVEVNDDGKGITKAQISGPKSFGIIGMSERVYRWGGNLSINGKRHKGTTITISIPRAKARGEGP